MNRLFLILLGLFISFFPYYTFAIAAEFQYASFFILFFEYIFIVFALHSLLFCPNFGYNARASIHLFVSITQSVRLYHICIP